MAGKNLGVGLGKPEDPRQAYFTKEQLKKIIEGAEGQYRFLFALLAAPVCELESGAPMNHLALNPKRWQKAQVVTAATTTERRPLLSPIIRNHVEAPSGSNYARYGTPQCLIPSGIRPHILSRP